MRKGGYVLVDFRDINMTVGQGHTNIIPGVYDTLYMNKRKIARLTGVAIGGVKYNDFDVLVEPAGNAFILLCEQWHFLVASNGVQITEVKPFELPIADDDTLGGVKIGRGITVEEDGTISAGGDAKLYTHTVTVWGDELGDIYTTYYIMSTSSDEITTSDGLDDAVYDGCIGIISQYGSIYPFMIILADNYTAIQLDGSGTAYPGHGTPHSDTVKEL